MMEQSSKPARKVAIADHIWEAFDEMAASMGTDRDSLINQAMFVFARLNGFIETAGVVAKPANGARPAAPQRPAAPPQLAPVQAKNNRDDGTPQPGVQRPSARQAEEKSAQQKLDDDPVRREVAERVLETAAELERLIKGKNSNNAAAAAEPSVDEPPPDEDVGMDVDEGEPAPQDDEGGALYLMAEGGELDKIAKERFVIGRGKHCDFVINSGKVSREHAVIVREGAEFFIEDLGSSNGTWFNKQRIKRRKIEDGDEYFICSEKIKLVTR
ncbi:MAG: FHA domain-containing protein [Myxococcaceae bacterium]